MPFVSKSGQQAWHICDIAFNLTHYLVWRNSVMFPLLSCMLFCILLTLWCVPMLCTNFSTFTTRCTSHTTSYSTRSGTWLQQHTNNESWQTSYLYPREVTRHVTGIIKTVTLSFFQRKVISFLDATKMGFWCCVRCIIKSLKYTLLGKICIDVVQMRRELLRWPNICCSVSCQPVV